MAVPSPHIRILVFAILGAVSGIVGAVTWPFMVVPGVFYGTAADGGISLGPAIWFAVALGAGIYTMVTQRITAVAAMMAAVVLGWWIAVEAAGYPAVSLDNTFVGVLHWLACGLIGAAVLAVTGALVGLYDRSMRNIAEIAIVGMLVVLVSLWVPQTHFWLLLTTWQAAVSAAIAHAIVRSRQVTGHARALDAAAS